MKAKAKNTILGVITSSVLFILCADCASAAIIANHTAVQEFDSIPPEWIEAAKDTLRVSYAHASHGSQILSGMNWIRNNINPSLYSYTNCGWKTTFGNHCPAAASGTLDIWGPFVEHQQILNDGTYVRDIGDTVYGNEDYYYFSVATRNHLNGEGSDRNVVMWSWCGAASGATLDEVNTYLSNMAQLEADYPNVKFVYMTGHPDGCDDQTCGAWSKLTQTNERIRQYVRDNNKILFDFADIQSWNPDGGGYCNNYGSCCATTGACSWCTAWCTAHPEDCVNLPGGASGWSATLCGHSPDPGTPSPYGDTAASLICPLKGKAFWWLMARLAGWDGQNMPNITSPPGLEVYMADPEVRTAQKLYCQINNTVPTDKLQVFHDNILVFEKNGNLQSEEVVTVNYSSQTAGNHELMVRIVDQSNNPRSNVFTKSWTTLHNGIPTVGIDENNAIRVNGELFFPVFSETAESYLPQWLSNGMANTGIGIRYLHADRTQYTKEEWTSWLNTVSGLGARNIGPAARWGGIYYPPQGLNNNLTIMQDYVETFRNNPALLMWLWGDEPDGGGTCKRCTSDSDCTSPQACNFQHSINNTGYCRDNLAGCTVFPDEIRLWTDLVHRYDTNHPHYVNLIAYGWARNDAYYVIHCQNYSYLYGSSWYGGEKKPLADIVGFDFYPVEYATKVPSLFGNLQVSFETMADAMDRIRDYNYDLVPILVWNENCDLGGEDTTKQPYTTTTGSPGYNCVTGPPYCTPGVDCPAGGPGSCYKWTPAPTADELWAELWIKVIHGAKGMRYHTAFSADCRGFDGQGGLPGDLPRNAATMQKFLSWMDGLKNVVLGLDYSGQVTEQELGGGRIDIMAKKHGSDIYIFAANLRNQSETARFTIDSVPTGSAVEVYGESRTISLQGNQFTDTFDDFGVHIYRVYSGNKADTDQNGCISDAELFAFIDMWKVSNVDVTLKELIEAIGLWKRRCG